MGTAPAQGLGANTVLAAAFPLLGGDGTAAAPTYSFSSAPTYGWLLGGGGAQLQASIAGAAEFTILASGIAVSSDASIAWTSSADLGGSRDTFLVRDAAGIPAVRNGTTAQTVRIYNTFTDASNYERLSLSGVAGTSIILAAETAGTGADNLNIVLTTAGTGIVTTPTGLSIGTNPATAGEIRITSGGALVWRNAANSANLTGYDKTGSNLFRFAPDASSAIQIGSSSSTIGFFGATSVAQPTGIANADGTLADITTKFNTLLNTIIETLGLSTTV